MKNRRSLAAFLASSLSSLAISTAALAVPLSISYQGRLVASGGKPTEGPVDLRVQFFDVETGGEALANLTLDLPGVSLSKGVFSVQLAIPTEDVDSIFSDSHLTFVQVTDITNDNTYARQVFSSVPYALRVPTDGSSVVYDTSGRLSVGALPEVKLSGSGNSVTLRASPSSASSTYTLPSSVGAGSFLTTDGAGHMSWASPTYPGLTGAGTGSGTGSTNLTLSGAAKSPLLVAGSADGSSSPQGGTLRAANAGGSNAAGSSLTIAAGNGTGTGASGAIFFQTAATASSGTAINTMSTSMTITPSGNVGIGTTYPQMKTEIVTSHMTGDGLRLRSNQATFGTLSAEDIDLTPSDTGGNSHLWFLNTRGGQIQSLSDVGVAGPPLALNPYGGNVAVGAASAQVKLEVVSGHYALDGIRVRSSVATLGSSGSEVIDINPSDTSGYSHLDFFNVQGAQIQSFNDVGDSFRGLSVNPYGGNVGIGTSTPAAPLHIAGSLVILGKGEGGTPQAVTLRAPAAVGIDTPGANFNLSASAGTGAADSGSINFQAAPAGASSTLANPLTTYMSITANGVALGTQTVASGSTYDGSSSAASFPTSTPVVFLTGSSNTTLSCLGVVGRASTGQILHVLATGAIGTGLILTNQASCANGYGLLTNTGTNLISVGAASAASAAFIFDGTQWVVSGWNN